MDHRNGLSQSKDRQLNDHQTACQAMCCPHQHTCSDSHLHECHRIPAPTGFPSVRKYANDGWSKSREHTLADVNMFFCDSPGQGLYFPGNPVSEPL